MTPTVVIVGRPNVGKSTLFNRLVGARRAIVNAMPGVTRDRQEGDAQLGDLHFRVVDTAGLEEAFAKNTLAWRIRDQTERALIDATVLLMVIDARAGVTPVDKHFADWLRRAGRPAILVANKCEGRAGEEGMYEGYLLGLGTPVPISAEHGEGLALLYEVLAPHIDAAAAATEPAADVTPLRLAVVGRPNVGKSTLVNALIGEERLVTSAEPGTTRDAIEVRWKVGERVVELVDTAGLRRRARITEKVEELSAADSRHAIDFAHVVALVLDATVEFERQDITIAQNVVEEGRALVIVANKWDVVTDRSEALDLLRERLDVAVPQVRGVPVVKLSALTGARLATLMPAVLSAYEAWNQRVSTGPLNEWLRTMLERHPPPLDRRKRPIKLRYMTQTGTRPPSFAVFCNRPKDLPASYVRYMENGLRRAFGFAGTPIRLHLRAGKNPYAPG